MFPPPTHLLQLALIFKKKNKTVRRRGGNFAPRSLFEHSTGHHGAPTPNCRELLSIRCVINDVWPHVCGWEFAAQTEAQDCNFLCYQEGLSWSSGSWSYAVSVFAGSSFSVTMARLEKDPSWLVCPSSGVAGRWEKQEGNNLLMEAELIWSSVAERQWTEKTMMPHFLGCLLKTTALWQARNVINYFFKKENSKYVTFMWQWLSLHLSTSSTILKTWIRDASIGLWPEPLHYPCVSWFASCLCASTDTRSC